MNVLGEKISMCHKNVMLRPKTDHSVGSEVKLS